jgi:hypothetical protein
MEPAWVGYPQVALSNGFSAPRIGLGSAASGHLGDISETGGSDAAMERRALGRWREEP